MQSISFYQVDQLLDEIRLTHVKDTKVSDLAAGERKRLVIACQVALNTGNLTAMLLSLNLSSILILIKAYLINTKYLIVNHVV